MVVRQLHASLVESLVLRWANSDLIRHITAGKEEALAQAHELAVSEQTLARQNTLLQSILSCMQESLLAADENGRFIVFNQSAQQTLGIGATGKSLLVRDINTGIYLPDQYTPCPMEHLPLIRAMRGEGVMEAELFIRRLGEDEGHWVSVNARPLVDDQGVLRGGVAIGRDISAQKRTLDMLRAHGQRLVEAQKLANMGSWEWEIATNTVTWSDELWYLYGLTPGQFPLSYESFIDRLVPEDRELVSEVISTALRKCELFAFDHRIIRADGCIRSMQSRGTVVLDREGTPIRMLGSEQDITERIETEEQLRFQKTLLECQGEASPDGILVVDAARHWISYNHRFIEMWNIPEHISEARSSDAALQWVRDKVVDSQSFIEKIRSLYGDEHKNEKLQDKVLLRDGRVFEQYSAPVTDAEGRSYGRVWHYHDITDRHVAEQQKAEFVSMVSHELRTPLTSIRASLGLLVGSGLGELSGPGRRMVEIAVANSDRLIRLINDILDTEQMEAGNVSLDKQACDVGTLMTQAVETMHGLAESAQVRLSVHPLSALLWADPDRVLQTLTNLLSNAIKFSPPASTVQVSARREGQQVVVQVKDQGRGIPADKLETIFDRFQQVFATDRREKDGAGLGLAICRNIVRQHGGRIWVESEQGKGSIFFVAFPLAQKDGVSENGGPVRDPAVPTAKPVSRRQAGGGSTNTFYRYRALWSRRYVGILRQTV
jgi:PAS domain S-box-containing protein